VRTGRRTAFFSSVMLICATWVAPVAGQGRAGPGQTRLLREAAARESRGDFAGAEAVLRRLLGEDPTSSGGLFALERVLRADGRTAAILPAVDEFLAREPKSSGVRYLKLRVLSEVDSLDALRGEAERWFALDPRSDIPYREVARVYERAFGREAALEALRRGRAAIGREDALALEIGDVLAAGGDIGEAVREWARAVGDDGAQAAAIARRVQGLPAEGREEAARALVEELARSGPLPRRRAGARVALDLGLDGEALELSRRVADELTGRARATFLSDVARRARENDLVAVAAWAYDELGREASNPVERRRFDQRIVEMALAAGDTTEALDAARRVVDSFSPGSVDRRRATARVIRLESVGSDPDRLQELLTGFREEFPNAPELDDLAASVARRLQERGDNDGAAAVLLGIDGPRSGLERGYLSLGAGRIEEGRRELLLAIGGLEPSEATEVIQFAGLFGRLSAEGMSLLAAAGVLAHHGEGARAAGALAEGMGALPEEERPALLAEAARMADRGEADEVAAGIRDRLLTDFPEAGEVGEAALALANFHARSKAGVPDAIRILEDLLTSRPTATVAPEARLALERLRERLR
jgi:hypothetical protein